MMVGEGAWRSRFTGHENIYIRSHRVSMEIIPEHGEEGTSLSIAVLSCYDALGPRLARFGGQERPDSS